MTFDLPRLKSLVSLNTLFERDEIVLRRAGADDLVGLCPVHSERTPSCHVHPAKGFFRCFGCGWTGDHVTYLAHTLGVDPKSPQGFRDVCTLLSEIAGEPLPDVASPRPRRKPQPPPRPVEVEEPLAPPLGGEDLARWREGCHRLFASDQECGRIAAWRGYDAALVKLMAHMGLIGLVPYPNWESKAPVRVAFAVERPLSRRERELMQRLEDTENISTPSKMLVGYHVRLQPRSHGNDSDRASWRYVPSSRELGHSLGAWPFVLGEYGKETRRLILLEGQWDALAFIDLLKWAPKLSMPSGTCVMGLRGATSAKLLLQHRECYFPRSTESLRLDAQAGLVIGRTTSPITVAIADADAAGATWFAAGGLVESLISAGHKVVATFPSVSGCKDFNDVTKSGAFANPEALSDFTDWLKERTLLRRPPSAPPTNRRPPSGPRRAGPIFRPAPPPPPGAPAAAAAAAPAAPPAGTFPATP